MKQFLLFASLSFVVGTAMYGQDLHTRSLRFTNAGVLSTLIGSPTGGTFTLPSTSGTLLSSSSGVQYGPSASQASLTNNAVYLFDVAYDGAISGSVVGARITSASGGQVPGSAVGLTIAATAADVAGSNATGLLVTTTATQGTNTIARLVGKNGSVIIDGRNTELAGTIGSLAITGAQSGGTAAFAKLDFSNYDQNGSGADLTLARIQAQRSGADGATLQFYTGTTTLNATPALTITTGGSVAINTTGAQAKLEVNGDVAIRQKIGTTILTPVTTVVDASGQSNVVVSADVGGGILTDIQGGSEGKILYVYNTANNLTIKNDAGTNPSDGILTMTGGDITTVDAGMIVLIYSTPPGRWLVTSFNP